jgi:hypothetical protein
MTELTKLSQREAEVLLDLSMKASRDNDILRILALLGLIYLPLTLGSVSFPTPAHFVTIVDSILSSPSWVWNT